MLRATPAPPMPRVPMGWNSAAMAVEATRLAAIPVMTARRLFMVSPPEKVMAGLKMLMSIHCFSPLEILFFKKNTTTS